MRSSVKSAHSGEDSRFVHVSTNTFFHKSWSGVRGGCPAAKYSSRWLGHHLDGWAPDIVQMVCSSMTPGRTKGVGLPSVRWLMAKVMNSAQIGPAPVIPVVFSIG